VAIIVIDRERYPVISQNLVVDSHDLDSPYSAKLSSEPCGGVPARWASSQRGSGASRPAGQQRLDPVKKSLTVISVGQM
jgi:hypothetical protein